MQMCERISLKLKYASYAKRAWCISYNSRFESLEFHCLRTFLRAFKFLDPWLVQCIIYSQIFASWNSSIVASKANFAKRTKKLDDVAAKSERVFFFFDKGTDRNPAR